MVLLLFTLFFFALLHNCDLLYYICCVSFPLFALLHAAVTSKPYLNLPWLLCCCLLTKLSKYTLAKVKKYCHILTYHLCKLLKAKSEQISVETKCVNSISKIAQLMILQLMFFMSTHDLYFSVCKIVAVCTFSKIILV